jgi:hypothetical protein
MRVSFEQSTPESVASIEYARTQNIGARERGGWLDLKHAQAALGDARARHFGTRILLGNRWESLRASARIPRESWRVSPPPGVARGPGDRTPIVRLREFPRDILRTGFPTPAAPPF